MSPPATHKEWRVNLESSKDFNALELNNSAPVPKIGDKDVLVKLHAASLNYRDLIIPRGMYPFAQRTGVVPASDGAGEVVAVGPRVDRFKVGDKVATLFNQQHMAGSLDNRSVQSGLGGVIDGALRQYGAFDQEGLVLIPQNLSYLEAATLPCAALTAWNALYGVETKQLKTGDWVVTQGTGGVSMFAVQFAKAAGARVIATTSSKAKADKLKALGADHVINYKEDPKWGETAKKLTGGRGVDHVIEVGGPLTAEQSLASVRIDGLVSIIGFLAGPGEKQPGFLEILGNIATVRGLLVGSRAQFEDMNRAIETHNLHPIVDEKVYTLEQTKEAYQYMWEQKHFGKLAIKIV
ncbi:hypothetical protein IWX90DRAFT_438952 [Phyllosticta citrichinensis]|uniref:Enoyl reductase (ER) domain-containing protein n=1 Tax=Phyllosticta citrichinensis TaxID=1130410 RepID=A0ABR1XNT4_9PEZI